MYHCSVFLEHNWFQERWRQQTTVVSRLTATFFLPGKKAIHFLDCEQTLLVFRFSERNARAREREAARRAKQGRQPEKKKEIFLLKKNLVNMVNGQVFKDSNSGIFYNFTPLNTATYSKFRKSKCVWHVILIGQVGYTCSCFVFRLKCISDGLITHI